MYLPKASPSVNGDSPRRDATEFLPTRTVAIEGPGATHLDEFEGRLVVAVDKPLAKVPITVSEDDLEPLLTNPLG